MLWKMFQSDLDSKYLKQLEALSRGVYRFATRQKSSGSDYMRKDSIAVLQQTIW